MLAQKHVARKAEALAEKEDTDRVLAQKHVARKADALAEKEETDRVLSQEHVARKAEAHAEKEEKELIGRAEAQERAHDHEDRKVKDTKKKEAANLELTQVKKQLRHIKDSI